MRKRQAVKLKEYFKRPTLSKGFHSRTEGVQERHVKGLNGRNYPNVPVKLNIDWLMGWMDRQNQGAYI